MGIFNISDNDQNIEKKDQLLNQENKDQVVDLEDGKSTTDTNEKPVDDKASKTIVIDGPLSNIYTQALNLVYAKEDLVNMIQDSDIGSEDVPEKDVYVYCCGSDDVNKGSLTELSDKIRSIKDSGKAKSFVLAVECGFVVTEKIALLHEYSESLGIKMISSRGSALETIKNLLK